MAKQKRLNKKELITASEIARFLYCRRAWWYDYQIRTQSPSKPLRPTKAPAVFWGPLLVIFAVLAAGIYLI